MSPPSNTPLPKLGTRIAPLSNDHRASALSPWGAASAAAIAEPTPPVPIAADEYLGRECVIRRLGADGPPAGEVIRGYALISSR
jgi:hypothetical protein